MPNPASWPRPTIASRARTAASLKAALREFQKRARTMRQALPARRQPVLFFRTHLAEGAAEAVGKKDRIVAESLVSARRPYDRSVDAAFERCGLPVGPSQAQNGDEGAAPLLRRRGVFRLQLFLDHLHRLRKVFFLSGPACRMDPRRAVERLDRKPGIVGER